MSKRTEQIIATIRIGGVLLIGGVAVGQASCAEAPAIVEPAAGTGIPDVDPTALPQAAPTVARVAPEMPPLATATAEAQPSPTPQMREIISLDGSLTQHQRELFQNASDSIVSERAFSEEVNINLQPKELNEAMWIEGADGHTTAAINKGYGTSETDTTIIIIDEDLQRKWTPLSLSEADLDLLDSGLQTQSQSFNVDSEARFQVFDAEGNLLGTRHKFPRNDGTVSARFIPDGSTLTYDVSKVLNGYEFNGIRYSFNPDTGEFSAMAPHQLEAEAVATESQRVAEYVNKNSQRIHLKEMDLVEFRASDALVANIKSELPPEYRELSTNPLFFIILNSEVLQQTIGSLSINVSGNKILLDGKEVVFTFLAAGEKPLESSLPHSFGWGNVEYTIGAYENNGIIHIICEVGDVFRFFSYEGYDEWRLFNEATVHGLAVLSGQDGDLTVFSQRFTYDSPFDDSLGAGVHEPVIYPAIIQPSHGDGAQDHLVDLGMFEAHLNQIPPEFRPYWEQ